ncbi:MAG: hypothetical protein AAGF71_01625 [Pseudomonadota bacterium]
MIAPTANIINAASLILIGTWGFLAVGAAHFTALIPVGFGVALLACHPGVKSENKIIAHVAVTLTLVILLALFMPLMSALGDGDVLAILRSLVMMATCVLAKVYFIKSFRDARKAREAEA